MAKRYYWMKLHDDYFENANIKIIEDMENGADYILFLFKLKLISIKTEGYLRVTDSLPYSEKTLSTVTNTDIDIVRTALRLFIEFGLVEILADKTIYVKCVIAAIGSETDVAQRVRKHREKQKMLQCNKVKQISNTEIETEIDLETEIESEREIEKENMAIDDDIPGFGNQKKSPPEKKESKKRHLQYVFLTEEEFEKLNTEYGEKVTRDFIERLNDYIGSKGKKYKSHYFTIKNWMRRDGTEPQKKPKACPKCGERYVGSLCRKCGWGDGI